MNALFRLDGRLAVVSGGGGLLGIPICEILAEAGASIAVVDSNVDRAQASADRLVQNSASGGETTARAFSADITDEDAVAKLAQDIEVAFQCPADILVNLAAYRGGADYFRAPLGEYPLAEWQRAVDVNLTGTFLMCREFGRRMYEGAGGVIVNTSSMYGLVSADPRIYGDSGINSPPPYAATKAGVVNLSRYLAVHWRPKVRVNVLAPGGVAVPDPQSGGQSADFLAGYAVRSPMGRMSRPDEYQGPILFLVSDASSYMTGGTLTVDGGWTAW